MTIEHIKAKDYKYFIQILVYFLPEYFRPTINPSYKYLGTCGNSAYLVKEFTEKEPLKSELHILKQQLISAFDQHQDFWCWLNAINDKDIYQQKDPEFGIQFLALDLWEEFYPGSNMSHEFYHPDMLKLLTKKCIWDVVFPNEVLPNYQEPECGELIDFLPDSGFD